MRSVVRQEIEEIHQTAVKFELYGEIVKHFPTIYGAFATAAICVEAQGVHSSESSGGG